MKNKELETCFKCKKKINKNDSKFGYNHSFCKPCFKIFDEDAGKEVDRMIEKAEVRGII